MQTDKINKVTKLLLFLQKEHSPKILNYLSLCTNPVNVNTIAKDLKLLQPTVSFYLHFLLKNGYVKCKSDDKFRYYSFTNKLENQVSLIKAFSFLN